jgi:hypothetical protein
MLSLFGFFKYKDEKIRKQIEKAISAHSMLSKKKNFSFSSSRGVITLTGKVKSNVEKKRIENVIKERLDQIGINYKKINNKIEVE